MYSTRCLFSRQERTDSRTVLWMPIHFFSFFILSSSDEDSVRSLTAMAYATNLAGSKLRAKLGTSLNEHVSAPTSVFAQQQLQKMGWSEGDGLGKRRQGMASHITVKRREDNVGLGHNSHVPSHDTHQWWKDSIGDTLAKLGGKKKKQKRDYTDEELFQATGGARFGMRAQRRAEAKWARTESQTEEDEQEALSRVEWNGQGAAEIKLTGKERNHNGGGSNVSDDSSNDALETESKNTKTKRKKIDSYEDANNAYGSTNEPSGLLESKKKLKKRKKNNGGCNVFDDANETSSNTESKKQRKKEKKTKKAKKNSKKSKIDKKNAEATD
jgi:Pin2-interacting protein X1